MYFFIFSLISFNLNHLFFPFKKSFNVLDNNSIFTFLFQNKISKSISFKQFLNSQVLISCKDQSKSSSNNQNLKYSIRNNIFKDCKSTSGGGAISVSVPSSSIFIDNCYFLDCFANVHGGGCLIQCDETSLKKSFFDSCICPRSIYAGQAFYTDTLQINAEHVSVAKCAPSFASDGFETIICRGGIQNIQNINSTFNFASQYASGWLTAESTVNEITYSTFYNNSSPNQIIALTHIRPDDEISFINIVKNTVTKDGLIYISGSFAILKNFVICDNKGPMICFTLSAGPTFFILDHCVTDINKSEMESVFPIMSDNKVKYMDENPQTHALSFCITPNKSQLTSNKQIRIPE